MTAYRRACPRAAVLLGAAALGLTACTGGSAHPAGHTTTTATPAASQGPWRDPVAAVRSEADRVLADTGRHEGSGLSLPLPGAPRGTEYVGIECRGHGTVTVETGQAGTYRMPCSGAGNGDEMEGYASETALPAGTLRVRAAPGVTWQVAVGWSAGTPTHPSTPHATSPSTPRPTHRTTAPHTDPPDDGTPAPHATHRTPVPHPTHRKR